MENIKDKTGQDHYDYIIVGGGSAGSVIARRLADNLNAKILLLEAGESGEGIATVETPHRWVENIGSKIDYLYKYHPAPAVNNRLIYAPRGKVLGGSGSINAMVWARGNRKDYDGWADAGNKGWDYQSVLPLFKKIEDWELGETEFHGVGGPIHIENTKELHFFDKAFIDAGRSYGMPALADTNAPEPEGVGPMSMNIKDGKRCSPFLGYLKPVMNKANLTVLTGAKVLHLNFDGKRCIGLTYLKDDSNIVATASTEVILSAGAFETPRILMLSGIGNAEDLNALGIESRVNLPGVGKNLQEHPLASVIYQVNQPVGQFTENLGGTDLYWKSSPNLDKPDLMLLTMRMPLPTAEIAAQHPVPENSLSVFVTLVDVKSRGYVKMTSSAHDADLEIQPNLLQETEDLEALTSGIELCMNLAAQPGLKNVISKWVSPPKSLNREEIKSYLRDACAHYFHPVGTCAMGNGEDAVVNNKLLVHGTDGLRIADASVMPQITTANTNAPTIMIAEFAAELILGKR
ncbi:GMC family oxidoreductase [Mucilaginibacter polytrichastri]|uniref:Glucose-methanol-choline oxidoreductase N-terminal domain-containing protein n=1 Tax=Mucilaginibacter polytrichastri TaxID=1302689 RepID=A0A1Q5ZY57_9SPHI|nr:GMC family oxidoreductase N-terminal domain-containing protein [Mucilaginibacter polytrichastri]OKS86705.1 hypothetical protein RG47T_2162 [Mucilaginibacter polytrichastri]SFS82445.1 choline dehydrogenase [Mucilaginibacter polytrichastri]